MKNSNLVKLRYKNKISIEELSKIVGISVDRLNAFENDELDPTSSELTNWLCFMMSLRNP